MSTSAGMAPQPRYRYRETPPRSLPVPAGELLGLLPGDLLLPGAENACSSVQVDLPCAELFRGNTPRLSVGTLSDLLPRHVREVEGDEENRMIDLPAAWLTLLYRLDTEREEIPDAQFSSPGTAMSKEGVSGDSPRPPLMSTVDGERDPATEKVSLLSAKEGGEITPDEEFRMFADLVDPSEEPVSEFRESSQDPVSGATLFPDPQEAVHPRRSLFASLPILRRHRTETPVPHAPVPEVASVAQVQFEEMAVPAMIRQPIPSETSMQALSAMLPDQSPEGQSALQALFMTEERLTLGESVALAAALPGLKACLLARGDSVLCTSDSSAGRDLRILSGQAMTLLSQIRASSSGMGLGPVPAVTLHAETGALSILQERDLSLVVLHSGRGFVPGVRERLRELLLLIPSTFALPPSSAEGSEV